jgi:membrane associated rhomboid family serine protease
MPRQPAYTTSGFSLPPARAVPVTATLCAILAMVSLFGTLLGRQLGVGLNFLNYQVDAIFNLELWRLVTFPFVESTLWGFLLSILVLWMFGSWFETTYGKRDYLRFFFVSSVGAGLLAIPLSVLLSLIMPFYDVGMAEGPSAAINAMLVAMAYNAPNASMLFLVFPMRARTMIFIILGYEVIAGIYTGAAGLSMALAGMLMGWLLVTGYWRPNRLIDVIRLSWLKRRRRGLYVVPPKNRTLN